MYFINVKDIKKYKAPVSISMVAGQIVANIVSRSGLSGQPQHVLDLAGKFIL